MFSTKLNDSFRYIVPCIVLTDIPVINSFVADTGAKYTCCSIFNINPGYPESDFENSEYKIIGGIVHGGTIKYYRFNVKQFTIGNLNMKSQDIWVTFDERATDDVLGMDILKQVYFLNDKKNNSLIFAYDTNELIEYIINHG